MKRDKTSKVIHPYSRKAKKLKRELLKPEKKKIINPLKDSLLKLYEFFKDLLENEYSSLDKLSNEEVYSSLEVYFGQNLKSNNIKEEFIKTKLQKELVAYENGIEIPLVTDAKICKRLRQLKSIDWNCIESLPLTKVYRNSLVQND